MTAYLLDFITVTGIAVCYIAAALIAAFILTCAALTVRDWINRNNRDHRRRARERAVQDWREFEDKHTDVLNND